VNKLICTLVTASVLVGGSAYGQNKTNHKQAKQALLDNQMDSVTAAGEENSSIAANNSTVTENNTGAVDLSGSALMGASGINIVSSTDALVANGVNVYDSSALTNASTKPTDVSQGNAISQDSSSEAVLSGYKRGENSQLKVSKSSNVSNMRSSTSSLNASLNSSTTDSFAYANDLTKSESFTDTFSKMRSAALTLNAAENSADSANNTAASGTTANTASSGTGGGAGTTGSSSPSNSASSGGSTSSTSDSAANNTHSSNNGSATNFTNNTANTATSASNSAASLGATLNLASSKSNTVSTTASKTHDVSASNDFSTSLATTLAASASDMKDYTAVKSKTVSKDVEGAVSFDLAAAKNIAVDGSTIDDTNSYSVTLAGSAQENAKALNIVNAAGGMVANGLNIAHTTNLTTMPTLTQTNIISQSR
jgi:hypothetical protein